MNIDVVASNENLQFLAEKLTDPIRLMAAEWNGYKGPLVCEGCGRTISAGHGEWCQHAQWIQVLKTVATLLRELSVQERELTARLEVSREALATCHGKGAMGVGDQHSLRTTSGPDTAPNPDRESPRRLTSCRISH